MTIDEAIKHCEEVAHQNEILMKRYDDASGYNRSHDEKIRTDGAKGCEQLISLYRQLVEWLKELKALYENDEVKDVFKNCDTCKYLSLEGDDFPCDRCCHRYINQYVYDEKREVNADADSD